MYTSARKLLFCLPPEFAHKLTVQGLKLLGKTPILTKCLPEIPSQPRTVMGINFKNPVGLAAGFDKNGDCIDGLAQLGFGFIELGTVTPVAQDGNPKPRMFRIAEQQSVINRLGFNNKGILNLIENIKAATHNTVIGINIGKNFTTPIADAITDYKYCMQAAYQYADYLTVNLSSPNTPNLRDLQYGDSFKNLLATLKNQQQQLQQQYSKYVPIAIKLAPDNTEEQLIEMATHLLSYEIDAVIATNTTIDHSKIQNNRLQTEAGGVSGELLHELSTKTISILKTKLTNKIPIIGVGGITNGKTATEKITAGASLVQLYTGMIYKGPALIKEVAEAIAKNN